jgi:hypothetical protein
MPTPTYTPLATVTLASATGSVTFSSIPATYRDLVFVFSGTATSANRLVEVRFNGDSGSNYSQVRALGYSSTPTSSASTLTSFGLFYSDSGLDTTQSNSILQLMDYSATDKHKTMLNRVGGGTTWVEMRAGRWANTAAITSANFFIDGNFATGTTLSLYGVIA